MILVCCPSYLTVFSSSRTIHCFHLYFIIWLCGNYGCLLKDMSTSTCVSLSGDTQYLLVFDDFENGCF